MLSLPKHLASVVNSTSAREMLRQAQHDNTSLAFLTPYHCNTLTPPSLMPDSDSLIFSLEAGVATIRLNRPDVFNSINKPLALALQQRLRACKEDASVRAVSLRAAGGVEVEVTDFGRFSVVLPRAARDLGVRLFEVSPTDESLESVFSYLVAS